MTTDAKVFTPFRVHNGWWTVARKYSSGRVTFAGTHASRADAKASADQQNAKWQARLARYSVEA